MQSGEGTLHESICLSDPELHERSEAIQNLSAEGPWIAHMGIWCVKAVCSALCSIAGQLFVPTVEHVGWRAQIESRSARRAVAKRLGLDSSEHAIRLWQSGQRADNSFSSGDPRVEPVVAIWFACQIKLTFGRRAAAAAPTFRLRRAGSRGRDHSSLRRLKPCNPSVRPPGSAEADQSRRIGFEAEERGVRRPLSRLPRSPRPRSRTSRGPRAACARAPRSRACGRVGCAP